MHLEQISTLLTNLISERAGRHNLAGANHLQCLSCFLEIGFIPQTHIVICQVKSVLVAVERAQADEALLAWCQLQRQQKLASHLYQCAGFICTIPICSLC